MKAKTKKRLDLLLLEKALAASRTQAQALILAGRVELLPGLSQALAFPLKPGTLLPQEAPLRLRPHPRPYASRGGIKLEHALREFRIFVKDRTVLDIGVSTGGFTDCLLRFGAKKVYAVDVGWGQLDMRLRKDSRVVLLEKTNARYLKPALFDPKPDLATVDVSFISLQKILPAVLSCLETSGEILALIKPQFEAGPSQTRKGIVREEKIRQEVVERLKSFAQKLFLKTLHLSPSPIEGAKGNVEVLWHLKCSIPHSPA